MTFKRTMRVALAASVCGLVVFPLNAQAPRTTGPIARYDMRAGTVSGAAAAGRGAGAGMSMMFGGGRSDAVQHELLLRLGSSQAPDRGGPHADHYMPENARLGRSVALITPREERVQAEGFPEGRRPKGRMLIYWGCSDHAGPGQPVVIDFSRMAAGQMPQGLWSTTIIRDLGPTLANSRTFGQWPAEDGKFVKPDSSLPGPHRVAGNYAPEIAFTLSRDFMAALSSRLTPLPSGSKLLGWHGIPEATGYVASMFGGTMSGNGEMGDMVMWSSSYTRQFGGGLSDWISPGQVAALVRDRTVLPPSATSCAIPAEAIRDAGQFRTGTLTAFGPEESFAYPPRPVDPRAVWNLQWTARIRHRSTTSWMDMPGMGGDMGRGGRGYDEDQPRQPACKPRRGGLGGMMGALGGLGGLGGGSTGC